MSSSFHLLQSPSWFVPRENQEESRRGKKGGDVRGHHMRAFGGTMASDDLYRWQIICLFSAMALPVSRFHEIT